VHFLCALQEIRWPGQGTVMRKNYMILYSGCKSDKNEFKKIVLAEALWIVY